MIPWGIGETARAFGTGYVGDFFVDVVEELLGDQQPVVARNLPPQVEMILGESAGRTVIHLLNYSGVRHNSIGPAIPVLGAELAVTVGESARALVSGVECNVVSENGVTIVSVPPFDLYETIVIEGQSATA
jgi:hypothetical protein